MTAPSTPRVSDGSLILRRWDPKVGLSETPLAFQSLDELFGLCLRTREPELVDRIVINGFDRDGQPRVLTVHLPIGFNLSEGVKHNRARRPGCRLLTAPAAGRR